jgi:tetratricopeptide (TPR) repeat protein
LALALQQVGCAAYYAAQRGDEAMARRDFESAVNEYREAVTRKPGSAEYQQKLRAAREARVLGWLAEAAQLGNSGDLNRAIARCEQALTDLPEHIEARTLHGKLTAHRQAAFQQLEAAKAALLARRDLAAAASSLRGLLPLAPTFPEVPVFAQQADHMLRSQQLDEQGEAQLRGQQYEPALAALTEAVRLDSGNAAAQTHLRGARDSYSGVLDKTAKEALGARRYSLAIPAFSRAAELWATTGNPADAVRGDPFRQRGSDVLAMLVKRDRLAAERAAKPRLVGLSWAHAKLALLLQAQASALRGGRGNGSAGTGELAPDALPILEPELVYPVALRVDGEPPLVERLRPLLISGLMPFAKDSRVQLVTGEREDPTPLSLISLRLGHPSLTTQPGRVEVRSQRYVARIDMQPNPRYRQLILRGEELSVQLQQLEGAVAVAGQNAAQAARRERRLEHAEQRARTAHQETDRRYREAESRAEELGQRVARLERQLAQSESELSQVESRLATTKDPHQRQSLEGERGRLRSQIGSQRRDLHEVRGERSRAVAVAEQLRLQRTSGSEVRELDSEHSDAERAARRARSDLDSVSYDRDRVASELAQVRSALASTPELVAVPIEADYQYSEKYFLRIARVDAGLRMAETGLPAALVELPIWADFRVEDFRREEHRVPGAPDLYIAPHPLRFPVDEELIERALSALSKETIQQLRQPLTGHGARFLRAAAAASGDARLNAEVLAHHAAAQIHDQEGLARARGDVLRSLGLDLVGERVNLAVFDGQ